MHDSNVSQLHTPAEQDPLQQILKQGAQQLLRKRSFQDVVESACLMKWA